MTELCVEKSSKYCNVTCKLVEKLTLVNSNGQRNWGTDEKDSKMDSHASSYVVLLPHEPDSESATGLVQTLSRPEMSQLTQT